MEENLFAAMKKYFYTDWLSILCNASVIKEVVSSGNKSYYCQIFRNVKLTSLFAKEYFKSISLATLTYDMSTKMG